MSQFFQASTSGITPSDVIKTLTPDVGGPIYPINGNINIFGQKSLSSQVMETTQNPNGTMNVENLVYYTRYVVDISTTPGIRGTYTTVQAAIDQAVIDQAYNFSSALIYLRSVNNSEIVTVPSTFRGFTFVGTGNNQAVSSPSQWIIQGANVSFYNTWLRNVITDFAVNIYNCTIFGFISNASANGNFFSNCQCFTVVFNGASSINQNFLNSCTIFGITVQNQDNVSLVGCAVSSVTLADSGKVNALGCQFQTVSGGSCIIGSSNSVNYVINCTFNISTSSYAIDALASIYLILNSCTGAILFSNSVTPLYFSSQSGNISQITLPAGGTTLTLNDSFIGIDTTAPRIVNMFATPFKGLTYTIADVTGSAGANNITVNGNGSNIDGAASISIASNYASLTLIYTGTIWKVI